MLPHTMISHRLQLLLLHLAAGIPTHAACRQLCIVPAVLAWFACTASAQTTITVTGTTSRKLAAENIREWTGTNGKTVKGTLKEADETSITIVAAPPTTATYKIALSNLIPAHRDAVLEWVARKKANEDYLKSAGNLWRADVATFLQLLRERTGKVPRPMRPTPGFDLPVGADEKPEVITANAIRAALQPFIGQKVSWTTTLSRIEKLKSGLTVARFVEAGKTGDEFIPGGTGKQTRRHPSFNFEVQCAPDKVADWQKLPSGGKVTWTGTITGTGMHMSFISAGSDSGYSVGLIIIEKAEPQP